MSVYVDRVNIRYGRTVMCVSFRRVEAQERAA